MVFWMTLLPPILVGVIAKSASVPVRIFFRNVASLTAPIAAPNASMAAFLSALLLITVNS
nr:hypothetical protein [Chitinophaga pinensis]